MESLPAAEENGDGELTTVADSLPTMGHPSLKSDVE